jgi:aminoglycoside phosphotransferase (APT) family kinase protein
MSALAAAGAPAPFVIACSSRPVVDGRAFALMNLMEGVNWEAARAEHGDDAVADSALDALARFQAVPIEATGLANEEVVEPSDEVARWARLVERCAPDVADAGRGLRDYLTDSVPPAAARPVLVHGDYHYGNLIFEGKCVVSVVDWEIAQIGDPLLDLGCLAVATIRRRYRGDPNPTGGIAVSPSELGRRYGADTERAAWFVALTCFKYTAILGYNVELHRRGRRPDPIYDRLGATLRGLPADGMRILAGGLDAAWPHGARGA